MSNLQFRCLSDLLSHQPQQALSLVLLWAARLNVIFTQAALDTKSLTGSSHRHDQSQKSHHCSCVHDPKLGRIAECYRRSRLQMMLFNQKMALSWSWFDFSLCSAFIGERQLSRSYIHLKVASFEKPQRIGEICYCTKGNKGPDGGKIWVLADPFDRALLMTGSLGALWWSPQGGTTQLTVIKQINPHKWSLIHWSLLSCSSHWMYREKYIDETRNRATIWEIT